MIDLRHGNCEELLKNIPSESIDVVLTDPPYKYLKNQKLEVDFDEMLVFSEIKRVLKKDGFIVIFGRGTSFYRWNVILSDLGFQFKEEIVWNKVMNSSPMLPLMRIHETVSIHTKGNGKIHKSLVPYLEMKKYDIDSIITDIKRLLPILRNEKALEKVLNFLESGDYELIDQSIKHKLTTNKTHKCSDRLIGTMNSMIRGMCEKSIIVQNREHYTSIHPTQKPVILLERLLRIVATEGHIILDPFMGSGNCGIACRNLNMDFVGIELDDEYFRLAKGNIHQS